MGWIIAAIVLIASIVSAVSKHASRAGKQTEDSLRYEEKHSCEQEVPLYEELQEEFFDEFEQQ